MPRDKTLSHEKVRKAVKEEFLEKGYEDASIRSIGARAGMTSAGLKAIASCRNIILFDEPTSGLDYSHMLQVSELLKKLRDNGKTVIMVTHDIELIKNACTVVIPFASLKK